MASSSSSPVYSRNLIDEFLKFLQKIALELLSGDIELLKFYIQDQIPKPSVKEAKTGIQLISLLKEYRLLSENNLDYLIELLAESRRIDLADRVIEYRYNSVNVVRNAPQAQMEERLPAPKMELLCLLFSGQTKTITAQKIDEIKQSICHALKYKISEVSYLKTEDEGQQYTSMMFQILASEDKIQQLQMDALKKKPWLIDLKVIELTVDKQSSIRLSKTDVRKQPKNGEKQERPSFPRVNSILVLEPELNTHCDNTLDIILAIELPTAVDVEKYMSILKECEAIKDFHSHSGHKEPLNLRLAQIRFGNHVAITRRCPKEKVAFLEKELTSDLEISTNLKAKGRVGDSFNSGIADALDKVCSFTHQVRREATKLYIMICFISSRSANLEHYRSPFDYDAIKLSHDLAKSGIPLYIIGIDPSGLHEVEENYFLSGITATTGGRYLIIQSIDTLGEAIQCIIKENRSIERIMGTVNDLVIGEINKQYGDVNNVHLTKHLHCALKLRSCKMDCITQNGKSLSAISQISERVSWADDLDDAITAVKSLKEHMASQSESQSVSVKPSSSQDIPSSGKDAPSKSKAAKGKKGKCPRKKEPKEFASVERNPDLEVCGRMVRRQIERSAYYRPTTEKNMY